MKNTMTKMLALLALITAGLVPTANAQRGGGSIKTDTRILYHNGAVMEGITPPVYLIWYGNWSSNPAATTILEELTSSIGSTPYFLINTTYPDSNGAAPTGGLLYAGSVSDIYSQGPTLTPESIQQIVADQILSYNLPLNTRAIYIVIGSSDVTDIRADGSTFCTPGTTPHHGIAMVDGAYIKYGYLGGANRCPTSAGPQFVAPNGSLLPTPNGNFEADAMASSLAHLFNVIITNPLPYAGWFDRYGLENADKCMGKFGETFTTQNGAQANVQWAGRPYLIQQNWINDRRGRCTMSIVE